MKVELLKPLNSAEGICDAARVSFSKLASMFTLEENIKLLKFLWRNWHWSPYGHARETFSLYITEGEELNFLRHANLAGFTWANPGYMLMLLNGSIWAWWENMHHLPPLHAALIEKALLKKYPALGFMFRQVRTPRFEKGVPAILVDPNESWPAQLQYVSFRLKAPIFVARQMVKHQIHLCWNEESRRYVSNEPEIYEFTELRGKPANAKQGSTGTFEDPVLMDGLNATCRNTVAMYNEAIAAGVAPEQARAVLPIGSLTEWIWTGSIAAWARVCAERLSPTAQKETRETAEQIDLALLASPHQELWIDTREKALEYRTHEN